MIKKLMFLWVLLIFFAVFSPSLSAENLSQQSVKFSADKVFNVAKAKHIPLVIVFYADWCADGNVYLPVIKDLETTYGDKALFLRVNVEDKQNEEFVKNHKSNKYLPQTVIYNKNFEKIADFTGKKEKEEIEKLIKSI